METEGGMGDRVRQWKRLAVATQAAVAAVALAAAPVFAQACGPCSTGEVAFPPSSYPSSGSLGVPVTASIASACTFNATTPTGNFTNLNVAGGWSVSVNFGISCNSNFRVGVVSSNGALTIIGASPGPGYTATAPYNVDLHLVGDSSASADSGLCPVANLSASTGSASACNSLRGPAVSGLQGLRLVGKSTNDTSSITMSAPAYNGAGGVLLTSTNGYVDTLTVTIAAST
jgi:hypothetical protein